MENYKEQRTEEIIRHEMSNARRLGIPFELHKVVEIYKSCPGNKYMATSQVMDYLYFGDHGNTRKDLHTQR